METKKTILIIADSWEYLQFYIKDKLDLNIVLFQSPERSHRDKKEICEEIIYLDLSDIDKCISIGKKMNNKYNFKAVWSFTDEGIELSSIIGNELGLPYNPVETSRLVNNKELMRQFLREQNFSPIKFKSIKQKSDLIEYAQVNGFPFIIKPTNGTASKDVVKITNKEHLSEYLFNLKSNQINLLAEEYLHGPEFSVETISFNGSHEIIQFTEKKLFPNSNIEMAHLMPPSIEVPRDSEIRKFILCFLNLIGHRHGPCHIEIKITSSGPKIIEAHTRPGGDFIVLLLADIFGVDVISETLNYVINGTVPTRNDFLESKGGVVKYFYSKPGRLVSIKGLDEAISHPNVINYELNFKEGEIIPKLESSFSRLGCLVVKAKTSSNAFHVAEYLIQKVECKIL